MEELFWIERNSEGLYEQGYLLTKEQVLQETNIKETDLASLDNESCIEGAYWGDDTYSVTRVTSLDEVKDKLTWAGYDPCESGVSVEMDEEYPDYVAKEYRLDACVYSATGYTSTYLPNDGENPTVMKYCKLLGLNPETDLCYQHTPQQIAAYEISVLVHNEELTEEKYEAILNWFIMKN